jgi:glycerol-3-phosphate responsive antiterminator
MPSKKTAKTAKPEKKVTKDIVEVVEETAPEEIEVVEDGDTPLVSGGVYRKETTGGAILEATVLCTKESSSGGKEGIIHIFWEAPRMIVEGSDELNQWELIN